MKILAIETSCDETSCAVVQNGREVLSNIVASQIEEHKLYGGVVPEIASRRHIESISNVCALALKEANVTMDNIDAVAVTYAPGLIGALLVGLNFAKGLSMAYNKPLLGVHHIKGHIASNYITHKNLEPPFLCLIVSGGHSHLVKVNDYTSFEIIGQTVDDAAGEAFDKAARQLGYPYPGGIHLDKASKLGDKFAFNFPTPKLSRPYNFSFSGLKTSVLNLVNNTRQRGETLKVEDVAASFQHRICTILSETTIKAAKEFGFRKIAVCGGVSANSGLREAFGALCEENNFQLYFPAMHLCGDNAAMIGCQGYYEYLAGNFAPLCLNGAASLPIDRELPFAQQV